MGNRLRALVLKESRELLRDPIFLVLMIGVPLSLMLIIGLGFSLDVKHLPVTVHDLDGSPLSREYVHAFVHSEYFDFQGYVRSEDRLESMIRAGRVRLAIRIPPDFSRRLKEGRSAPVQFLVDGSYPSRAQVSLGYTQAVTELFNRQLLTEFAARGRVQPGRFPIAVDSRTWFNPSLESKNFIVPGLMVTTMMFFPALVASLVVVKEKESGSIYNLYTSPAHPWEIVLGKALPYIGVVLVDYFLLFGLSVTFFDVRFIGNPFLLTLGSVLYISCTIGLGMIVSVLVRTQVAAMLITFVVTVIPAMAFSGFLAPVSSQDAVGQFVSRLIPAAYFMTMVRGIYLKGLGFVYYGRDLLILAIYTVGVYAFASFFFRKRID